MKKIIIFILSIIFIILLFINYNYLSISILNSTNIFLYKLLPSLLPLYIISRILTNYNMAYYISKLFNNNKYIYIFILCLLGGCPNNVIIIKDLLNKNIININEANKYIKCSFFTNPLFLYTMLSNIFSIKDTLLIIVTNYISNIIIYLFNKDKNINSINKIYEDKLINVLSNSLKDISIILINIYITIIFFNIIIYILPNILNNYKGLIEISYGLNYLSKININYVYKIVLSIIYICFGGLSINIQVYEIIKDTKIKYINFLVSRFIHIIINLILFTIL